MFSEKNFMVHRVIWDFLAAICNECLSIVKRILWVIGSFGTSLLLSIMNV